MATRRAYRVWWQAAAVAAVLVGTFFIYNIYNHQKEPAYVVVSAAAGKGIIKHQLPDQSEVWLEPGTTVRYQEDFREYRPENRAQKRYGLFFCTKERGAALSGKNIAAGCKQKCWVPNSP